MSMSPLFSMAMGLFAPVVTDSMPVAWTLPLTLRLPLLAISRGLTLP
jgi:hypothetical protein